MAVEPVGREQQGPIGKLEMAEPVFSLQTLPQLPVLRRDGLPAVARAARLSMVTTVLEAQMAAEVTPMWLG